MTRAPMTPPFEEEGSRRRPPLPGARQAGADRRRLAALAQGSAAWIAARVGHVTASRVADVVARSRAGFAAARGAYLSELLAERLSGRAAEPYLTPAMAWGRRHESGARAAYEFFFGVDVVAAGFLLHPTIPQAGASPDGLIGADGLLEIKCPTTAAHLALLLGGAIPDRHQIQMQWQMACAGRRWCDYVSFDPRLPEPTRFFLVRVARDETRIAALEDEVRAFLGELEAREALLRQRTAPRAEAAAGAGGAAAAEDISAGCGGAPADAGTGAVGGAAGGSDKGGVGGTDPAAAKPARRRASPRQIVDVAATPRKPLTPKQRLALYEAHGGICCICGNRIIGQRWIDEHVRPLSLGGTNDWDNRAPAHERCAQEKTRDDLRRLAKAKAQKRAHLGLKAASRPIASRPFPRVERIRPNLSPLGPPRAARLLADDEEAAE